MRWLLFLSRVAFICNICFLLALSIRISNWVQNQDMSNLIVLVGYVLVVIFNPLVNLCYLILFVARKKYWQVIPHWLITANILFLVIQLLYIVYLNHLLPQ